MRPRRAILALALTALTSAAVAEPYRDDLAVPAYRLLASMLAQFRDGASLDCAGRSTELAAPLMRALDQKYGAEVEGALRRAIAAGDRDAAFAATMTLVLVDAQNLLDGIARDDYTGWAEAQVRMKKAFLDYRLVAEEMRRRQPDLDQRTVADFGRLAMALHGSDMTTPPERIDAARQAVIADLVALRAAMRKTALVRGAGEGRA